MNATAPLSRSSPETTPERLLRRLEWQVIRRLDGLLERYPGRIHPLNFDAFATDPVARIEALAGDLGLPVDAARVRTAAAGVVQPDTMGRWRSRDLSDFSAEQLGFCRDTGWPVDRD